MGISRLIDEATNHSIWAYIPVFMIRSYNPLTEKYWEEVQELLIDQKQSPVYFDLLFDAEEHLRLEDFQRAIVDSAVACESYMRSKVQESLPGNLNNKFIRYIDEANIRQVLEKFFPEILDPNQKSIFKKIQSELNKLFDARNTILHSGYLSNICEHKCNKFIDATKKLLALTPTPSTAPQK